MELLVANTSDKLYTPVLMHLLLTSVLLQLRKN